MALFDIIDDNKCTITSLFNSSDGLAPKNKSLSEDNAVVAISPGFVGTHYTPGQWHLTRKGTALDQKSLLVTFELLDSEGNPTGYYLNYDYVKSSVVINKSSRPVWIVSQNIGDSTHYQISPLFSTGGTEYLTYSLSAGQEVTVTGPVIDDALRQVWIIRNTWNC